MNEAFKALLDTKELWIPAITALFARFSATRTGGAIEKTIKDRLSWLRAPDSEKAFFEAFEAGVENYSTERGHLPEARSAARILSHCISDDTSNLSLPNLLQFIVDGNIKEEHLLEVANDHAVEFADAVLPSEKVAGELNILINQFLHRAFLDNSYFTQQVGFAEVIALLKEIRKTLITQEPDLDILISEYRIKLAEKHDVIPMQGISPKIHNRTIGIRMEDVFIPLELTHETPAAIYLDAFTGKNVFLTDLSVTRFDAIIEQPEIAQSATLFLEAKNFPKNITTEHVFAIKNLSEFFFAPSLETASLRYRTSESAKIDSVLSSARVVIKGDPGSGKSTLARYITWALTKGRLEVIGSQVAGRLPVLIRAIDFGEALEQQRVTTLEEYLAIEAGRFAPVINNALLSGSAVVLIDGLDEVGKPALRSRVKERTDDFIADPAFSANHIVITTRIVGYERSGLTGRFQHFTITSLTNEQIERFIRNWYFAIQRDTPGSIDAEVESSQLTAAISANESIRKMARNPLLLTIIALIKWQGRTLPEQRVLLYDAAAQTLIKSWPLTQRKIEFDELFIREWLAPVALHILSDRTGDLIDEYSLTEELSRTMQQLRSMTELQARTATRELLDNISEHSGFLLPRDTDKEGNNLYGFLHQTFAEYLAAYYLIGRWEDEQLDLARYAHDSYLWAGTLDRHR